jgi:hypothetical protein
MPPQSQGRFKIKPIHQDHVCVPTESSQCAHCPPSTAPSRRATWNAMKCKRISLIPPCTQCKHRHIMPLGQRSPKARDICSWATYFRRENTRDEKYSHAKFYFSALTKIPNPIRRPIHPRNHSGRYLPNPSFTMGHESSSQGLYKISDCTALKPAFLNIRSSSPRP